MTSSELLIGYCCDGLIIRVVGRGTMQESPAVRATVERHPDAAMIVFDAMQCSYVDSTFLGCLIAIKKTCEKLPGRRFVIAATAAIRVKLFSTSSLSGYFDFIGACPEPIGKLVPIDVEQLAPLEFGRHIMRCHELLADRGGEESGTFKAIVDRLAKELDAAAHKPTAERPTR